MKTETLSKPFSLERVGLLMRNRLFEDVNAIAIVIGVSAGLNVLSLIMGKSALFNRPLNGSGQTIWFMFICLGGILLAGRAFQQMHNGRGGSDWLLLPATPLEKYTAAFASYVVAYPLLASLVAFGLSAVLEGLAFLFNAPRGVIFNPLIGLDEYSITGYVIFASFALAASARFAKLPLVKTAAIAIAWGIAFGLVFMGGLVVFTPEGRTMMTHHHAFLDLHYGPGRGQEPILEWIMRISCYVSGIFAIAYGYFRVAEKEAIDEVQ
jgi:hypothetical protein